MSTGELDENGFQWWQSNGYAIWWKDHAWRVGLAEDRGTTASDIVSVQNVACPHSVPSDTLEMVNGVTNYYRVNTYWPVTWKIKNEDETWIEAATNAIYTLPGDF